MRKFYLLLLIAFFLNNVQGQTWTWSTSVQYRDATKRICRDAANNIFLFKNYNFSSNEKDTIKKINSSGNLLFQFILPEKTALTNLVATPDTGFFLAGTYYDTVTISNHIITGNHSNNIWFAKYNSAGVLEWIKTFGSKENDALGDICVRGNGFVITGALSDTAYYMGQTFPKAQQSELFVAVLDGSGNLQTLKFATSTNTTIPNSTDPGPHTASSWGYECEVDGAGNIYIACRTLGETKFDGVPIGKWGSDPSWPYLTTALLKLDAAQNLQFTYFYSQCQNYCYSYDNLVVSPDGNSYVTLHWSYGQSGNDLQSSTIYHVNSAGVMSHTYTMHPQDKSDITDLEIDNCGNLNFTGYWYTHWYDTPFTGISVAGQLNPDLQVNWLLGDTSYSKSPRGTALCKLQGNDFFLTGFLMDTTTDQQGIFPNGNVSNSFFARFSGPTNKSCDNIAGFATQTIKNNSLVVFPNPGTGTFFLPEEVSGSDLKVYNSRGELIFHEVKAGNVVSLEGYPAGVYLLRVTTPYGSNHSAPVVIAK